MFLLKKLIATLVAPLPLFIIILLLGALLWWRGWRRSGASMMAGAALLLTLASWGPVADTLIAPLEGQYPAVLDAGDHGNASAVVVLGSAYYDRGDLPITSRLSATGLVRLTEGVRLLRQMAAERLVVCGGPTGGEIPISRGYAETARALGVDPRQVFELDQARDTAQEAHGTRTLLGEGATVLLVTSASHMPRAMKHFSAAGLNPIPAPTRHRAGIPSPGDWRYWVPSSQQLQKTERALYEYMGMVSFYLDY